MDRRLLTKKIQKEIFTARAIAYPDPLTGDNILQRLGGIANP